VPWHYPQKWRPINWPDTIYYWSDLSFSRMKSPISRATSLTVFLLSLVRLRGAIGQLLFDSTIWWFEPAQSQLRRQIIHQSFFCAIFVSKPAPNRNDPVFVQPSNIELGEAPATGKVILHLFHALVLQECIHNRLGIARIFRRLVHLPRTPKKIASKRFHRVRLLWAAASGKEPQRLTQVYPLMGSCCGAQARSATPVVDRAGVAQGTQQFRPRPFALVRRAPW
jgi:hypothetical protein